MKRNGQKLKTLEDGDPRRMSDGKNAWRKMNDEQRETFLDWIRFGEDAPETKIRESITVEPAEFWEGEK